MKGTLLKGLVCFLVLGVLSTQTTTASAQNSLEACKIEQVDKSEKARVGWPKKEGLIKPVGSPKILIVGVEFPDKIITGDPVSDIKARFQTETLIGYFKYISDGNFTPDFEIYPEWVTMPNPGYMYGQESIGLIQINGEWNTHLVAEDAASSLPKDFDIGRYDAAIYLVMDGSSLSGNVAYATILDGETNKLNNGNGNYIVIGARITELSDIDTWKILAHEINHLLGLPDLYNYLPDSYWKMLSTAPFGLQGYTYEMSSDAMGWNRWLNGWIKDAEVFCLSNLENATELFLDPPFDSSTSGYQMVVIPVSKNKVIVVEALKEYGFVAQTYPNSVLIYSVDSSLNTGASPIRIIPRKTELTTAELSRAIPDWIRFKEAPLTSGEYLLFDEFLVFNSEKRDAGMIIEIYKGTKATAKFEELEKLKMSQAVVAEPPIKPIVEKTIICKKKDKKKVVKGVNPKCPKGYRKVSK